MLRWLVVGLLIATLILLAFTTGWWLTPLLAFVGANTDLIQGLTDLVQLLLWLGAAAVAVMGWLFGRRPRLEAGPKNSAKAHARDRAVVAQQGSAAAGQMAIAGNIYGNVNVQLVADNWWQAIGQPQPAPDLRAASQAYLQHLIDRYRYLDFKGMGVSDRIALRLELIEMYVPLKGRIEMPEGETWSRDLRLAGRKAGPAEIAAMGQRLSEPQPVLDLIQKHNGLIILGDPGAGKTTILKYLTLQLALGHGPALGLGQRLPLLLPLSAYANALAERNVPLDQFIVRHHLERGIDLPLQALLAEALVRGGALLLLDGLDEVKDLAQRRIVVERVLDFFTTQQRRGNKFILTSRIVGYREVRPTAEGLAECTLVDFEPEEIEAFIQKWTTALERAAQGQTAVAMADAEQERQSLLEAVERNPGVRALAANPLLLTILALMKRQGITLPERRVELYQKYVETLLKTWNLARGLGRSSSRDLDVVETIRLLAPLALWMHQTSPGVGLVKREPLHRELERICAERQLPQPEQAARQLLDDARHHAGLLLERGAGEYGFIHLTFQEYLAAVAIAQRGQRDVESVVETLGRHVDDDNWHEVSLLTIGYMGIIQQLDEVAGEVVRRLIKASPGKPGAAIVLAGQAVVDALPGGVDPAARRSVQSALSRTLAAERQVAAPLRSLAGDALARLAADERPGVGLLPPPAGSGADSHPSIPPGGGEEKLPPPAGARAGAKSLPPPSGGRAGKGGPDLVWCAVPPGPFLMGSDPAKDSQAYEDEQPQHTVDLPGYLISRYPVTQAQFAAFVAAGGYRQPDYWPEAAVQGFWQPGQVQNVVYYLDDDKQLQKELRGWRDRPYDFGPPYDLANHPVVGVTWYEALAFCRWLTDRWQAAGLLPLGWQVCLPSEAEWEKAARGGLEIPSRPISGRLPELDLTGLENLSGLMTNPHPHRRYPWGNEPDPNRANYDQTGIGTTSAVGCFPGGRSPYGCEELSGNVWEWTRSLWGKNLQKPDYGYPYLAADGREKLTAGTDVLRVLRGGSFLNNEKNVRAAIRFGYFPVSRDRNLGFRVCVVASLF
jgi:formylglycine-generating enzyme required for sulfatase activity